MLSLGLALPSVTSAAEIDPTAIVRAPNDVPAPVGKREPTTVTADIVVAETMGRLADGTEYWYWTFGGTVPGPMIRAKVGDTVVINLKNGPTSAFLHNVDLHAATGMKGGGDATNVNAGEGKSYSFVALNPGLYVYHCATPSVATHIANGMYGMILVEPEEGLPVVDREFYVMQGEMYTEQPFGTPGLAIFDPQKLLDEKPEYYVFNGAVGALTTIAPLTAKVGETVRIYFGVGGPNKTSSFHVIGEVFDRVYNLGSLTSPPIKDVQTVSVPPGGAIVVDFRLDEPGTFLLVDHALSRAERGLAGVLKVEGEGTPLHAAQMHGMMGEMMHAMPH
jgi:nitrite reductase (NO-forming)